MCKGKDIFEFIALSQKRYYCEAIIYIDGSIDFAEPSHIMALTKLYLEKNTDGIKTEQEMYDLMPVVDSPIHWLVNKTGCVAVWDNGTIQPSNPNDEQIRTFGLLVTSGCVCPKW